MFYKTLTVSNSKLLPMNLQFFSEGGEGADGGADTGTTGEGGQEEPKTLTLEEVQKMIQSETDKVRTAYSKEKKELLDKLTDLERSKLTDAERTELERQELDSKLQERERAVRISENKLFATQTLLSEGLNAKYLDLVTDSSDERTLELIKVIKAIREEDEATFKEQYVKSTGRDHIPGGGSTGNSLSAQLAARANQHGQTQLDAWGKK